MTSFSAWTLGDLRQVFCECDPLIHVEAKHRLQQLVPDQKEMSFCYPCYMEHVGCGPTRQSYVPVVARHHIAGRGKGEFPFANPPATVDLHYAWS